MSGTIIQPPLKLTEDQIKMADMIKELLALTLEGKITSIGLVGCKKEGFFTAMSGRQASDLNLACDHLKQEILWGVTESSEERASRQRFSTIHN